MLMYDRWDPLFNKISQKLWINWNFISRTLQLGQYSSNQSSKSLHPWVKINNFMKKLILSKRSWRHWWLYKNLRVVAVQVKPFSHAFKFYFLPKFCKYSAEKISYRNIWSFKWNTEPSCTETPWHLSPSWQNFPNWTWTFEPWYQIMMLNMRNKNGKLISSSPQ